jgi:RNA polymerase sigma-70 factor (ECF subfamily)
MTLTTKRPTHPDCMGDASLIDRMKAREESAFTECLAVHGAPLLATAKRMLGNEHDAADALQEAFLSAFRAIHTFNGDSSLRTWLHRITINTCLMKKRADSRRPCRSIEESCHRFDNTGHHTLPVRNWNEPLERMSRDETRVRVRQAIAELPAPHRTVLVLRDIEELDTAATAEILRITQGALKVRLHRARQALRSILDGQFADES